MPSIRHALAIDAPAERIYPLVSAAQGLSQWWAADVTENLKEGTVDLGFFNRSTIYRLKPARMELPACAEWAVQSGVEWNGTRLIFELNRKDKGGVSLRFTHADWQSDTDYFISCNTVWGELMFRLKATAEGKSPGPLFARDAMAY
jgi:hypothetical protein